MIDKPALTPIGEPFPRIPVDETEGGDFTEVLHIAARAANNWNFTRQGAYRNGHLTGAERTRGTLREGLLHLLELGVIDIDGERLAAVLDRSVPIEREREES